MDPITPEIQARPTFCWAPTKAAGLMSDLEGASHISPTNTHAGLRAVLEYADGA